MMARSGQGRVAGGKSAMMANIQVIDSLEKLINFSDALRAEVAGETLRRPMTKVHMTKEVPMKSEPTFTKHPLVQNDEAREAQARQSEALAREADTLIRELNSWRTDDPRPRAALAKRARELMAKLQEGARTGLAKLETIAALDISIRDRGLNDPRLMTKSQQEDETLEDDFDGMLEELAEFSTAKAKDAARSVMRAFNEALRNHQLAPAECEEVLRRCHEILKRPNQGPVTMAKSLARQAKCGRISLVELSQRSVLAANGIPDPNSWFPPAA